MHRLTFMALIATLSSNAFADWNKLHSSSDGFETVYIDNQSILRKNQGVIISCLVDFNRHQQIEESSNPMFYKSISKQFEFDCKKAQYRMIAYNYYSDSMGKGHIIIGDSNLDNAAWQLVNAHSFESDIWRVACDKK